MTSLIVFVATMICLAFCNVASAREQVTDTITAGIQTTVEQTAAPFGYRVSWIQWDSHFRDSALEIGDRIVGIDDQRYEKAHYQQHHAIGDYRESAYWEQQGAKDGQAIELIVIRGDEERRVAGAPSRRTTVSGQRRSSTPWATEVRLRNIVEKDENGRRLFSTSWANWYEQMTNGRQGSFPYVLDGGWERAGFNNRKMLKALLDEQPRIDYAQKTLPRCLYSSACARLRTCAQTP